jgi:hypothetical protein
VWAVLQLDPPNQPNHLRLLQDSRPHHRDRRDALLLMRLLHCRHRLPPQRCYYQLPKRSFRVDPRNLRRDFSDKKRKPIQLFTEMIDFDCRVFPLGFRWPSIAYLPPMEHIDIPDSRWPVAISTRVRTRRKCNLRLRIGCCSSYEVLVHKSFPIATNKSSIAILLHPPILIQILIFITNPYLSSLLNPTRTVFCATVHIFSFSHHIHRIRHTHRIRHLHIPRHPSRPT